MKTYEAKFTIDNYKRPLLKIIIDGSDLIFYDLLQVGQFIIQYEKLQEAKPEQKEENKIFERKVRRKDNEGNEYEVSISPEDEKKFTAFLLKNKYDWNDESSKEQKENSCCGNCNTPKEVEIGKKDIRINQEFVKRTLYTCPNCKWMVDSNLFNYCSNCGAKFKWKD